MQDNTFSDTWQWVSSSFMWHKTQKPLKEICRLATEKQNLYSQGYHRKSWKTDNDQEKIFATLQQVGQLQQMTSSYKEVPQWNKRIKPFKLKLAKGCEQANRRTVSRTLFASKSPEVRFQRHLREGIRNDVMCEWLKAGRLFSPEGNGREQHGPIKHNASHTWHLKLSMAAFKKKAKTGEITLVMYCT